MCGAAAELLSCLLRSRRPSMKWDLAKRNSFWFLDPFTIETCLSERCYLTRVFRVSAVGGEPCIL